jgi:hypothetical protein
MTTENHPHEADRDRPERSDVPAGGAGADSGATSAVGIDAGDTADVQNISSQNDIAGVGTRAADGGVEASTRTDGDGAAGARDSAVEQERRAADPAFTRDDEAAGAASHNARVSSRDAGDDASRVQADDDFQHLPRMAQNAPSRDDELAGIAAQTRADLGLGIPATRVPDILRQRLSDAGIAFEDADIDELAARVLDGA